MRLGQILVQLTTNILNQVSCLNDLQFKGDIQKCALTHVLTSIMTLR